MKFTSEDKRNTQETKFQEIGRTRLGVGLKGNGGVFIIEIGNIEKSKL